MVFFFSCEIRNQSACLHLYLFFHPKTMNLGLLLSIFGDVLLVRVVDPEEHLWKADCKISCKMSMIPPQLLYNIQSSCIHMNIVLDVYEKKNSS